MIIYHLSNFCLDALATAVKSTKRTQQQNQTCTHTKGSLGIQRAEDPTPGKAVVIHRRVGLNAANLHWSS